MLPEVLAAAGLVPVELATEVTFVPQLTEGRATPFREQARLWYSLDGAERQVANDQRTVRLRVDRATEDGHVQVRIDNDDEAVTWLRTPDGTWSVAQWNGDQAGFVGPLVLQAHAWLGAFGAPAGPLAVGATWQVPLNLDVQVPVEGVQTHLRIEGTTRWRFETWAERGGVACPVLWSTTSLDGHHDLGTERIGIAGERRAVVCWDATRGEPRWLQLASDLVLIGSTQSLRLHLDSFRAREP